MLTRTDAEGGSGSFLRVNVSVTSEKSILNGHANLIGLRLPGAQTDARNLVARVQSEHGPREKMCQYCGKEERGAVVPTLCPFQTGRLTLCGRG